MTLRDASWLSEPIECAERERDAARVDALDDALDVVDPAAGGGRWGMNAMRKRVRRRVSAGGGQD